MSLNTIKTTLGFIKSLLGKHTPLDFKANSLQDIFNFLEINNLISTSGQPTEKQFSLIQEAGFENVINLAPHDAENSLKNEAEILSKLSINYIHIPVDFSNPTGENFKEFASCMQGFTSEKVWVHCAANMRVSAFIYRYRCNVLGEPAQSAKNELSKIWEPFGAWKEFIA